jgi:hypothetical protein
MPEKRFFINRLNGRPDCDARPVPDSHTGLSVDRYGLMIPDPSPPVADMPVYQYSIRTGPIVEHHDP